MPTRDRVTRLAQRDEAMASAPYPELQPEVLDGTVTLPAVDDLAAERQQRRDELWAAYDATVTAAQEEYRAACQAAWQHLEEIMKTAADAYFGTLGLELTLSRSI